jgi:hypothetical protein
MKRLLPLFIMVIAGLQVNAQGSKYIAAMEANIAAMDTTHAYTAWQELGNNFERIANAEKNQWLPFYYSAVCNALTGYMLSNGAPGTWSSTQTDQIADKSEAMLNKAEELEKNNSEIYCVRKMIATLRMMGDPMTRYQVYGPQVEAALSKAKSLNPDNPRVYMLEGQDKFFTPEQFGGSKAEAKVLFEKSVQLFASNKPKSSIDPHWGLGSVQYFLSQIK